jgi:hypothetical protein
MDEAIRVPLGTASGSSRRLAGAMAVGVAMGVALTMSVGALAGIYSSESPSIAPIESCLFGPDTTASACDSLLQELHSNVGYRTR